MAQWVRTLNIESSWGKCRNDEISVQELAKEIVQKLKAFNCPELEDIIEDFISLSEDECAAIRDFDYIMQDLYDWADIKLDNEWNGKKNCWIKTF